MSLTPDEVRHVAMLARLALEDGEAERLAPELAAILAYAEQIGTVVADVAPTVHAYPLADVLREDVPAPSLPRDELLAAAPEVEQHRFAVPRIVGEDDDATGGLPS